MSKGELKKVFKVGVFSNLVYLGLICWLTDIESLEVILDSMEIYMNIYVAMLISMLLNGIIVTVLYYFSTSLNADEKDNDYEESDNNDYEESDNNDYEESDNNDDEESDNNYDGESDNNDNDDDNDDEENGDDKSDGGHRGWWFIGENS